MREGQQGPQEQERCKPGRKALQAGAGLAAPSYRLVGMALNLDVSHGEANPEWDREGEGGFLMETLFIPRTRALKRLKDYPKCHFISQDGSQGMILQFFYFHSCLKRCSVGKFRV